MDTRRWALELDNLIGKPLYFLINQKKSRPLKDGCHHGAFSERLFI
ncbi:hypothetical protein [Neobacillus terrae]|nr:hypothetical protein [Neobacillus terrae]NHM31858.1 hypothetical protein [Neobacillus terrae]